MTRGDEKSDGWADVIFRFRTLGRFVGKKREPVMRNMRASSQQL